LIRAAKAGVPIAFGTDAGSPVVGHDVVAPELAFMVKLGVKRDNYDALRSATAVAAQVNRLDSKLGTLEVGKEADVIVVAGDPLADLAALDHVALTFIAGKKMIGVGG
jgi:imidazolonepropionase-like amidohydrolase